MLCYALYDAPSKAVELVANRIRESMRLNQFYKTNEFCKLYILRRFECNTEGTNSFVIETNK